MREKITKVLVLSSILIVIGGIWVYKNFDKINYKNQRIENNVNNAVLTQENDDFKLEINNKIDMEKLKSYKVPIIIDFGSESCAPCRQMAKDLKEVNSQVSQRAIVRYADVWKNPELAMGYDVSLIPTQIFIDKNGNSFNSDNLAKYRLETIKDARGNIIYTRHIGPLTKYQMLEILKEMGMNE